MSVTNRDICTVPEAATTLKSSVQDSTAANDNGVDQQTTVAREGVVEQETTAANENEHDIKTVDITEDQLTTTNKPEVTAITDIVDITADVTCMYIVTNVISLNTILPCVIEITMIVVTIGETTKESTTEESKTTQRDFTLVTDFTHATDITCTYFIRMKPFVA